VTTTPPLDADALSLALERGFRRARVDGFGSPLVTEFPKAAADAAMAVVGPFLEQLRAEAGSEAGS